MTTERLVPGPAIALAGLLGASPPDSTLPPLWHWVYLLDRPAQDELGPEGHPRDGVPSPPAPGLARMFTGGRVRTRRPLVLDRPAEREVSLVDTRRREGRHGPLTIVTTRAVITQDGEVAVKDEQDIVYRPAGAPRAAGSPGEARPGWTWRAVEVDETLLFRFSALTYNAHRIHYDVDWCRSVEGYDGLVVHGPLQALLMAEACRRAGGRVASFAYRLVSLLTLGQGLVVGAAPDGSAAEVRDASGRVTATATAS